MKATRKAFTLIELIIVIVILGILAGITYMSYATFANNSKDTAVEQTTEALARQVKALSALDQGGTPQDWHDYVADSMSDINTATVTVWVADGSGPTGVEMPADGSIPATVEDLTVPPTAFAVTLNGRSACMVFPAGHPSPTAIVTVQTGPDWAFNTTGGCAS